jgi:hypothetical protein
MLRSGFVTGATLKACIKVTESYLPEDNDSSDEEESVTN